MTTNESFRDTVMEQRLQSALNNGHDVWVVGDVHGHHLTLQALTERLDLSENDWVVFLGDLIDRGPDSFTVVEIVKQHPRFVSVTGNHEAMMVQHFHRHAIERPNHEVALWYRNGGAETVFAYEQAHMNVNGEEDTDAMYARVAEHTEWMASLPSHIVLDQWRLVHAGYAPGRALDEQSNDEYLWIRDAFHRAKQPVDSKRTVVFGHTPTAGLPGFTSAQWGAVWNSPLRLNDGRPAAVGIDTCLYHRHDGRRVLTAYNLQTGATVQQDRVELRSR